ncbi:MAG: hypothetical protein A2X19_02065 [Bacteroidetes bacterium GWE2_39_28]|nr:MAG: hypothetical protein A2X19_02065 [Bacteroidetes bacterium GWE2_39_28]OFY12016.1 MAG: hypothetical protein A2X16_05695 [Bacteroidetes bacterium GWF2_39_10]OFZ07134.1 MAG: hypothetical protein A2322_02400 [Bacteroidetes bacterium RIFOXYB2_FULL_39_7]OFZ11271.1 MAG: hypothetical protein A2465_09045 [Bacteroidetes bacterium RIFOXYC2_FULL_39_11]HCT95120.1 hypothetical protein [Rikenellaceae bacterium]
MKKTLIALLAVITLIISCSKVTLMSENESPTDHTSKEPALLRVKTPLLMHSDTKSIIQGSTFPIGSKMGVQLLRLDDDAVYAQSGLANNEYTFIGGGEWTSTSSYILSSAKAKVYAYYPYTSLTDNNQKFFTIPISVDQLVQAEDYMYATPAVTALDAVSNTNSSITLNMNHALAQVSILVYKENYNGLGELSEFSIEDVGVTNHVIVNKDVDNDLMMNITDGTITGGTKGKVTRTISPAPVILQNSSADPEFPSSNLALLKTQVNTYGVTTIIVPTGAVQPGELKFSFVIDGNTYSINNGSQVTFEKGKQYIYKVKLAGTSLTVSSVTIAEWEPVSGEDMVIQ